MLENKGGISLPLIHCLFNGVETTTHFIHDHGLSLSMYQMIPNIYTVLVADKSSCGKKIIAGFMVKTTYEQSSPGFTSMLSETIKLMPNVDKCFDQNCSLITSKVNVQKDEIFTEDELTRIITPQFIKHHQDGRA